ncbi:MAG: IS21 family transposase [Candidatus Promineifilaceae bacterium]
MRKIREVLRLKFECNLSNRQIAESAHIARSTVGDYVQRAKAAQLSWPLPEAMDDTQLEQKLFFQPPRLPKDRRPPVDFAKIHKELKRKGVTLMLLWHEYRAEDPHGYQYSQFCHLYRQWRAHLDPVMRQEHRAGEKLFVDYSGMTVAITDPGSGKTREAQIFIACLGASNYTYAEATLTQNLEDWIGSHIRALEFLGAVPELIIPDNLKSGVTKACRYEPDLNPTYLDMANHYETAVIPARVRAPRDKAKAEVGVQIVERWILAKLRNRSFFSIKELNRAIATLLAELNNKPFQKLSGTRSSLFETLDKPALKPLPATRYQFAQWKKARVNIDYHVEIDRHYYSVPHQLVKKELDIRLTSITVECFYKGKRVASHVRSDQQGRHTTIKEHMPEKHRKYLEWTPQRLIRWAAKIGPHTAELIEKVMGSRRHPQQGFRSCLGILRLAKSYGEDRLEAAARRANTIGARTYGSIESILKNGLDRKPWPEETPTETPIEHSNIRGGKYYG